MQVHPHDSREQTKLTDEDGGQRVSYPRVGSTARLVIEIVQIITPEVIQRVSTCLKCYGCCTYIPLYVVFQSLSHV